MRAEKAMSDITKTDAWSRLEAHCEAVAPMTLSDMFAADAARAGGLSWEEDGLSVDLSRQRLTAVTLELLVDIARAADVEGRRDAMFAGQAINTTENRAVSHVALRDESTDQHLAMTAFADAVRAGAETGSTGLPFRDVVNIGIGGSHQGPLAATTALGNGSEMPNVHYVANVDGTDLSTALHGLDPAATLFLVASKTFTTAETMANAKSARAWLVNALGEDAVAEHFCALSTNIAAAAEFGIPSTRMFPFADGVGGRFSLWSSIGLSTALAIGGEGFENLLAGARAMDRHFADQPLSENLPVLLALTDLWNRIFLELPVRAVLPYDERLRHLPAHLQQLEMESNGKGVTLAGDVVSGPPASVIFGATGTNGQHSFHQLLHQGPALVAAEFIAVAEPGHDLAGHHDMLLANMLAQAEALANGTSDPATPHHHCPGNRPSTVILLRTLDPFRLGQLLALYEHKVLVEGVIWNINSFDQFGVELGKVLAGPLLSALKGDGTPDDPATAAAVAKLRAWRH